MSADRRRRLLRKFPRRNAQEHADPAELFQGRGRLEQDPDGGLRIVAEHHCRLRGQVCHHAGRVRHRRGDPLRPGVGRLCRAALLYVLGAARLSGQPLRALLRWRQAMQYRDRHAGRCRREQFRPHDDDRTGPVPACALLFRPGAHVRRRAPLDLGFGGSRPNHEAARHGRRGTRP